MSSVPEVIVLLRRYGPNSWGRVHTIRRCVRKAGNQRYVVTLGGKERRVRRARSGVWVLDLREGESPYQYSENVPSGSRSRSGGDS